MHVAMFAAGIVKLETRAGGQPDSGDASVVQGRSEFVEAMDGTTPLGNQRVDGDVEDTGCLAQVQLRSVEGLFKRNYERRRATGKEKRRAEPSARL
ncbi:MAG: hypothetical protein DMG43_05650 [Acidobacteria bacterium]|nr:MAG: hypothetical protein DMG43_05650 [Acidobacteriota bacterium]